jgi:hypothetical protein
VTGDGTTGDELRDAWSVHLGRTMCTESWASKAERLISTLSVDLHGLRSFCEDPEDAMLKVQTIMEVETGYNALTINGMVRCDRLMF